MPRRIALLLFHQSSQSQTSEWLHSEHCYQCKALTLLGRRHDTRNERIGSKHIRKLRDADNWFIIGRANTVTGTVPEIVSPKNVGPTELQLYLPLHSILSHGTNVRLCSEGGNRGKNCKIQVNGNTIVTSLNDYGLHFVVVSSGVLFHKHTFPILQ